MSISDLELLAPVGQMEVLRRVVEAGADAVYLGGKRFNMRALKSDYHFSDAEIAEAVEYTHQNDRKIYITVNNLYNDQDILEIKDYLVFLSNLGVDAFIVQDLGIIEICHELGLPIPLHASVQMGIANLAAVRLLESQGFERVILSKNVTLAEIRQIAAGSELGIEYFVHGDQCISHAGQCYMSSFIAGESGNQGRCRKPCRWEYDLRGKDGTIQSSTGYYLAHKDLCLYPYLAQLVDAGVSSFKIEGRMRGADYLGSLVSAYRRALDKLKAAPELYRTDEQEYKTLEDGRIRDFTAGNLLGAMGRQGIGVDGSREPFFLTSAEPLQTMEFVPPAPKHGSGGVKVPELSVRLGGFEAARAVADLEIDNFILGSDGIRQPYATWNLASLEQAIKILADKPGKVFVETPRIVSQRDWEKENRLLTWLKEQPVAGIVVNDLGSLKLARDKGISSWAGYGLNTYNSLAARFLSRLGAERFVASLELKSGDLHMMLEAGTQAEIVVQGAVPGMIMDYCVIRAAHADSEGACAQYCLQDRYMLVDSCGQAYPVICDENCRNYVLFPYEVCLLPYLDELRSWGIESIRIEGQYYETGQLRQVVEIYSEALKEMAGGTWQVKASMKRLFPLFPQGMSSAAFSQ